MYKKRYYYLYNETIIKIFNNDGFPIYNKCKTCKYIHFISPTQAKCRHFIFLNKTIYTGKSNEFYCENNLYLNVEEARLDGPCGKNATYYERRLN